MPESENKIPTQPFENIYRPKGIMLVNNFLSGIAWSFGTLVGAGLIFVFLGFIISKIDFVPIIGKWVADIIIASQSNLAR